MKLILLLAFAASALWSGQIAIVHGKVWTGDPAKPWAEAVLIDDARITAVGTTAEIEKRRSKDAQVIDAGGKLVTPGFNDAHVHFVSGTVGMSQVDLSGICTLESIQKTVADFAKAHPDRKWITGRGWEYYCFPNQRLPRREDLDAVVKDRPVFLSAYDGHTGWANSKAMEMADINKATTFSGYGEIVKDEKTGEPTGCLKEGAQALVRKFAPVVTRADKLTALRQGMKLAAELGLTSIQNASGDEAELELYDELLKRNELSVRSSVAFSIAPEAPLTRAAEVARVGARLRTDMLRVRAVKLVMDGVIESYTAAMLEPYANNPGVGSPAWSAEKFNAMVARCDKEGLQVYTHAIGDRAVRMTLDGYENAAKVNGPKDRRHRVEHIETVHPDDLPRFAKLNVMASMEPIHADPDTIHVWSAAVGPKRLPLSFAWRSLEKAGARLVFSSDWPASISVNPIRGIHNAVNRRTIEGKPEGGWLPEQRVSVETALRAYTTVAAYASFEEKIKGSIRPGMLADVICLSQDLFTIDPIKIHQTKVDWTVFGGKLIYKR